jgi:fructose-bisphosphate aldolase class II
VGSRHGLTPSILGGEAKQHLDVRRIVEIKQATGALLTLHGGSGTDDEDFRRAIKAGITVIHINTELRVAFRRGLEAELVAHPDEVVTYKLFSEASRAVAEVVRRRLDLFTNP